jgi:putative transposase
MADHFELLEPEHFYHIYNHAVSNDNCFINPSDYYFFLEKFKKYACPFFDLHAYTLMPNHFHLVVNSHSPERMKETLEDYYQQKHGLYKWSKGKENMESKVLSKAMSNLFDTYTKNFNSVHSRKGALFMRPFKRKVVTSDTHLQDLIKYVHLNPVEAKFCKQPSQWKYSSYNEIIGTKETIVKREAVIELFFNRENFIFCNTKPILKIENGLIEDISDLPF